LSYLILSLFSNKRTSIDVLMTEENRRRHYPILRTFFVESLDNESGREWRNLRITQLNTVTYQMSLAI
jgi:hypothetical protein